MTGLCPLLNAHGDTVGLTQGTEALKTNCVYSAFGEYSNLQGTPFRYNGQYYDTESGLYYLRNRYYDPTIGRFTQEDPVKSGLNWYAYCNNNPVKFCDPWGLDPDNYVMVKYSVEKIGGSIVGYDSQRMITYIGYNGMEVGYQIDRIVSIQDDNGDIVNRAITNVDSLYDFVYSMGYRGTPENLLHNPGDEFNSMNETAYAWALRYNKQSVTYYNDEGGIGYELGSYIYLNREKGTYYFGYPAIGREEGENGLPKRMANTMSFGNPGKAVAMIHSHGADDIGIIDEQFSAVDINLHGHIHKYIVTPSGNLKYAEEDSYIDNPNVITYPGWIVVGPNAGIFSGGYIDG